MKNRRAFFATIASGAALLASGPRAARAQSPSPSPAPPAEDAAAAARAMKRFDPSLTDEEIVKIARDVQDARSAAKQLNPKKKPLRNDDEPVTQFAVRE